MEAKQV